MYTTQSTSRFSQLVLHAQVGQSVGGNPLPSEIVTTHTRCPSLSKKKHVAHMLLLVRRRMWLPQGIHGVCIYPLFKVWPLHTLRTRQLQTPSVRESICRSPGGWGRGHSPPHSAAQISSSTSRTGMSPEPAPPAWRKNGGLRVQVYGTMGTEC